MKTNYLKRKITWLTLSGLMALSLAIAACSPAVVEKPEVTEKPKPEVEKPKVVEPVVEKPKYGGVLRVLSGGDITSFDDIVSSPGSAWTWQLANEPLISGDWTKGPAGGYGTNETGWLEAALTVQRHLFAGYIAESWEFPKKMEGDRAKLIFHIRKGVHWALNPESEASRLVGGREMTTDDVLFSLKHVITDRRAYVYTRNPELRVAEITSPAPWTVTVEVPWQAYESATLRLAGYTGIRPPEVIAKYGTMKDWWVSVGTGPFILTNNVAGSSATLVRNPNYWMKDPVGPGKGNQLPYLDGVKFFIIPDRSTQLAAIRTGKVDVYTEKLTLSWEDGLVLKKTAPPFLIVKPLPELSPSSVIHFSLTTAPFNDVRVRRAMHMAIDFETINKYLYDGLGFIYSQPIVYPPDAPDAYFGPELIPGEWPKTGAWPSDTPESVKEIYVYNPEKAKQLLAEAGYPQGFKTHLTLGSDAEDIDYYSIYKDMWREIGIEVELRPKETGALATYRNGMNDAMVTSTGGARTRYYDLQVWRGQATYNTMGSDPDQLARAEEAFEKIQRVVLFDRAEADRVWRELIKHALDQVWGIPMIAKPGWYTWPVWLKNYSGERMVNVGQTKDFYRWVWLDQELKKQMGY